MRICRVIAIIIAVAVPSLAQEPKGDLAKLQGTWTTKIGPKKDVPLTWIVKGDKVTSKIKTAAGKDVTTKFTIKLDEKAEPKQFDQTKMLVDFGGDVGGIEYEDSPAIYELKENEWRMCLVPVGSPRPKVLASSDESDLLIFRRVDALKTK